MLGRSLVLSLLATNAAAGSFSFVALGDTTYAVPADNPLYEKLIQAINESRPAFSIHVGDTKGYGDCGRPFQESQRAFFERFAAPVFYAPGNNEWADCWKENRGNADPTEILKLMREVFWSEPKSLGAHACRSFAKATRCPSSPSSRRTRVGPTAAPASRPSTWAVRVSVDTSKPWVYGFEPLYAAEGSVSPNKDN